MKNWINKKTYDQRDRKNQEKCIYDVKSIRDELGHDHCEDHTIELQLGYQLTNIAVRLNVAELTDEQREQLN